MSFLAKFISTFFYSGLAPKAPGTFGTLASSLVIVGAYSLGLPLSAFVSMYALLFLVGLYGIGFVTTARYMVDTGKHDPKEVVIDETLGIYITYMVFLTFFSDVYADTLAFLVMSGVMFVVFRFFDILKPFPVSFFDKEMDNAHGVMLDDAMAGIYAGLVSSLGYYFYI